MKNNRNSVGNTGEKRVIFSTLLPEHVGMGYV